MAGGFEVVAMKYVGEESNDKEEEDGEDSDDEEEEDGEDGR